MTIFNLSDNTICKFSLVFSLSFCKNLYFSRLITFHISAFFPWISLSLYLLFNDFLPIFLDESIYRHLQSDVGNPDVCAYGGVGGWARVYGCACLFSVIIMRVCVMYVGVRVCLMIALLWISAG